MITEKEIESIQLSATKKDFYQIWNELLETASKLSERWDPTSTNESDPGIVLLKVLTAIADKLNYNIDKNILEAFMPSAAQEESMRKLCSMLGYDMKYYQSAETTATIKFIGQVASNGFLKLDDTNTIEQLDLPRFTPLKDATGQIVYTTTQAYMFTATNTINEIPCIEGDVVQCSANNSNIISITNLTDNFRYYLPETQIAENGIFIFNIANGKQNEEPWTKVNNLNTQVLGSHVFKFGFDSKEMRPYIQFPEDIATIIEDGLLIYFTRTNGVNGNIKVGTLSTLEGPTITINKDTTITVSSELFSVTNKNAATNGTNAETLTNAYNNYKKTIGTFDTLVTCRDYMNKIYQLYDENNNPLVSNIIVSDIRDDINRAYQLCSFNEFGISYTDYSLKEDDTTDKISNFDLVFYPFKTVYGLNTEKEYKGSFEYSPENLNLIKLGIDKNKTLSHKITLPKDKEIACIKNYLKLNAKITTVYKVNAVEQKDILESIYKSIYKTFNARQLDFGEDIPFDTILTCIENADTRIKNVSLEEPEIETKICLADGSIGDEDSYTKLAIRNILAGKVPLFKYSSLFKPSFTESKYNKYADIYENISKIKTECKFPITGSNLSRKLTSNEVIQFRAPSFRTTLTYPAYVNYFADLNNSGSTEAIPAVFMSLRIFMAGNNNWQNFFDTLSKTDVSGKYICTSDLTVTKAKSIFGAVASWNDSESKWVVLDGDPSEGTNYYYYPLGKDTFAKWHFWVKSLTGGYIGLCKRGNPDLTRQVGYLVDNEFRKYTVLSTPLSDSDEKGLDIYFIQDITAGDEKGLGKNANIIGLSSNGEYRLKAAGETSNGRDEYIYINYKKSSTDSSDQETKTDMYVCYGPGTIIRPNFNLKPSSTLKSTPTKIIDTGTKFTILGGTDVGATHQNPEQLGMFSFGANEQLEIREPVIVKFEPNSTEGDQKNIFVYWALNNGSSEFKFDATTKSYILKDGEYFFYTDANQTDLAWYGSGCEIKWEGIGTPVPLKKIDNADEVSVEDILENGLSIVPWVKVTMKKDCYLTVQEFQFVNLTAGDTLVSIEVQGKSVLDNNFTPCTKATYKFGDGDETPLPDIAIPNQGWQVRSGLELNVGPNLTQTLSEIDEITITYGKDTPNTESISGTANKPLSIKTNYLCQSTLSEFDITDYDDFAIELFTKNEIAVNYTIGDQQYKELVPLNNFGNYWTKLNFSLFDQTKSSSDVKIDLFAKIGADQYGLLMIYYKPLLKDNRAYLTAKSSKGLTSLTIFNNNNKWWENASGPEYSLREGINVIQIPESCTITLNKAKGAEAKIGFDDTFIIGDLDIVNIDGTNGINTKLLAIDDSKANDLLEKIASYDIEHNFYYNNIIDNSNAIDFNLSADENLKTPTIWYDYNNINNKFVISEIDADYMKNGIQIARTSKL